MKTSLIALIAAAAFAVPTVAGADPLRTEPAAERSAAVQLAAKPTPAKSGHVAANGIRYYYEVHAPAAQATGAPLLLLHGGMGSIDMFAPILPMLSQKRTVIGVDLHGHGRTALGERKISLPDMGDDMAAVLKALGFGPVDVLGYSLGAGVAFRLAVQHPASVRRLALVSGGFAQDGFHPELLPMQAQVGAAMAEQMKDTPMR